MSKKKVSALVKLQVKAGSANPSPPVGTALGPHGIQIMEFCKQFNERTKELEKGMPTPVEISIYADRSFSFITKTPPASYLLKKMAGLKGGSATPNTVKVAKLTVDQLKEIVHIKMPDLTATSMPAALRTIAGTARSMGIDVDGEIENVK